MQSVPRGVRSGAVVINMQGSKEWTVGFCKGRRSSTRRVMAMYQYGRLSFVSTCNECVSYLVGVYVVYKI